MSIGHFRRRRARAAPPEGGAASGASARARRETALSGGREADIIDLGDGTVLRRYRTTGFPKREALVMEHARGNGFPVPRVVEVRENSLVLERIDGITMWADIKTRPWRTRAHVHLLADLHAQLHAIEAPPELDAVGDGRTLLHLDFHPDNVLLSPAGPVIIDWTNARAGDAPLDVALTWVIWATSGGALGRACAPVYLRRFRLEDVRRRLPAAAQLRLADPNVTDRERRAVRRLVARNGVASSATAD